MDIPLFDILSRLNTQSFIILAILGLFLLYFMLPEKIYGLMFLLTMSAAFVTSSVSAVADIASLVRWIIILLMCISGFLFGRIRLSIGVLLFWGYVFLGLLSLFGSTSFIWQFQRGLLLLIVAVTIPIVFGDKPYSVYKLSLLSIAITGAIYSFYNFIPLPDQLSSAARLTGFSKGASDLSLDLGALLPFTFWGIWKADTGKVGARLIVRLICGLGFLVGIIMLFLSGQRSGVVAVFLGLAPMVFLILLRSRKAVWGSFALFVLILVVGYFVLLQSGSDRIDFLMSRYNPEAGLSDRDLIWRMAISEIGQDPILGHGTGAAETVFISSFHNTYLEVWFNTGIFGLILYLAAQAYFFYRIFVSWWKHKNTEARSILALALGYMVGFVPLCLVESIGATASSLQVVLYLFLGVIVSNDALLRNAAVKTIDPNKPPQQPTSDSFYGRIPEIRSN